MTGCREARSAGPEWLSLLGRGEGAGPPLVAQALLAPPAAAGGPAGIAAGMAQHTRRPMCRPGRVVAEQRRPSAGRRILLRPRRHHVAGAVAGEPSLVDPVVLEPVVA